MGKSTRSLDRTETNVSGQLEMLGHVIVIPCPIVKVIQQGFGKQLRH